MPSIQRLFCAASLLLVALPPLVSARESSKPNVIVIMADDMGYADAGFTGATDIQTPNLDQLAASGVTFTQGYSNHPFCGPSRAALLTGRYQHRFGLGTNPAYDPANPVMGMDPGEVLFPKRLQGAGYVTGCVGKWHLGAAEPFNPLNRGFDYFYGFLGGGHDYFEIDMTKPVKEGYFQHLIRNRKPAAFDGYLTTALSRDAARFVADNKNNPFFLYVAYNAPHAPLQAPKEAIQRYSHIKEKKRRIYAAMVDVMDRGIGEIVTAVQSNGLSDNTLIFFLSDNGGPQPKKHIPWSWNGSSNKPFRGGKGNFYDGGIHVPFIASWPDKIKPGSKYDKPVIAMDIAATAVEVAGADASSGPRMEGVNLMPYVLGEKSGAPHDALFWRNVDGKNWSVLASDGTKYLRDKDSKQPQMFYLPDDVSESNDILPDHADRAERLRQSWLTWDEENVECRLMGYKDYHLKRDEFFSTAVPEKALNSGFQPEVKSHFKK